MLGVANILHLFYVLQNKKKPELISCLALVLVCFMLRSSFYLIGKQYTTIWAFSSKCLEGY